MSSCICIDRSNRSQDSRSGAILRTLSHYLSMGHHANRGTASASLAFITRLASRPPSRRRVCLSACTAVCTFRWTPHHHICMDKALSNMQRLLFVLLLLCIPTSSCLRVSECFRYFSTQDDLVLSRMPCEHTANSTQSNAPVCENYKAPASTTSGLSHEVSCLFVK